MYSLRTKCCEFVQQVTTGTAIVHSYRCRCVIVRRYSSVPSRTVGILARSVGITLSRYHPSVASGEMYIQSVSLKHTAVLS